MPVECGRRSWRGRQLLARALVVLALVLGMCAAPTAAAESLPAATAVARAGFDLDTFPTSTGLTVGPEPSWVSQAATLTATVSSSRSAGAAPPGGSVQFFADGAAVEAPVAVGTDGRAVLDLVGLAEGVHRITAGYLGDDVYAASDSAAVSHQVVLIPTEMVLTSSVNPSTVGAPVTFAALVIWGEGGTVRLGSVQFSVDGAAVGGPVALDNASVAQFSTDGLAVGQHVVGADYLGAERFAPVSRSLTQLVGSPSSARATVTMLTSSVNPAAVGLPPSFTATVTTGDPAVPVTEGSVQFSVDGVTAGPPRAVDGAGTATLFGGDQPVGSHGVTATYLGTFAFGSSAASLILQVVRRATSLTLTSSSNPAGAWRPVTFTARAIAGGTPLPSGVVQFEVDGRAVGAPLATDLTGTAALTIRALRPGVHQVSATLVEDATFAAGTATLVQYVQRWCPRHPPR